MDNTIRVFSGRKFSPEDIEMIKWARKAYPKLPRNEFASTVCELLKWTTPAGSAKRAQCVAFLEKLEAEGRYSCHRPIPRNKTNAGYKGKNIILTQIGYFLNVLVLNSELLSERVKELGIRGFIEYLTLVCEGCPLDKKESRRQGRGNFVEIGA